MDDEFMPLSITGISLTSGKNDISLSQVSRLSRSYIKSRKIGGYGSKSACVTNSRAQSTVESMVTTVDTNQYKVSQLESSADGLQFCPVCQVPFDILKVHPDVHVNQCFVSFDELKGKYI